MAVLSPGSVQPAWLAVIGRESLIFIVLNMHRRSVNVKLLVQAAALVANNQPEVVARPMNIAVANVWMSETQLRCALCRVAEKLGEPPKPEGCTRTKIKMSRLTTNRDADSEL